MHIHINNSTKQIWDAIFAGEEEDQEHVSSVGVGRDSGDNGNELLAELGRLEAQLEETVDWQQRVSLAKFKWTNGRWVDLTDLLWLLAFQFICKYFLHNIK